MGPQARRSSGLHWPYRRLLSAAPLLLIAALATGVHAQESLQPSVSIHQDVLNSLSARPPQTGAGEAALLPAPDRAPRSFLMVKPKRSVKAPPPPQPAAGRPAALLTRLAADAVAETPPDAIADSSRSETALPAIPPPPPSLPSADTAAAGSLALLPPPPPPAPGQIPDPPATPQVKERQLELPQAIPLQETALPAGKAASDLPATSQSGSSGTEGKAGSQALTIQISFESGSTDLSDTAQTALADLAADLPAATTRRIILKSYATGEERAARRLSLSRAQAVRSFLVDKGVASTRIDVRPLGATSSEGAVDRVDIIDANR